MASNDEILEMFFDEEFVPQAYLDILLSSKEFRLKELQSVSSSLLSRLDYYTTHLTKELEFTIQKLQKPAEILTYTNRSSDSTISGTTKLEYYLETLGCSVKALEKDVDKITQQLDQLNVKYKDSNDTVQKIRGLETVKDRLLKVLHYFENLKRIIDISIESKGKATQDNLQNISLSDFSLSLRTLQDTIVSSLKSSSETEKPDERNSELLKKIDLFSKLKPVFKGLTKFYPVYSEFVHEIKKETESYLEKKDIDEEFAL